MAVGKNNICHCGLSGKDYGKCCGRYHTGVKDTEKSPLEVLMTRYSAFCEGKDDYLLKTWHKDFRPDISAKKFSREIKNGGKWLKLQVLGVWLNEDRTRAMIKYELTFRDAGGVCRSICISSFVYEDGKWFYTDEVDSADNNQLPGELDSKDSVLRELAAIGIKA